MKKISSVILAVMVLLSMFTFATSAINVPEITMTADKTTAAVGEVITVTVSTSKKSKLCAFSADMNFPADKFEVVSAEAASGDMSSVQTDDNRVRFALISASNISDDATTLFTVKLKVKASGGRISLNVIEAYCLDNGKEVNVTDGVKAMLSSIVVTVPSSKPPVVPDDYCTDGHIWSTWARLKKPTCSEKGEKIRNCTRCGAEEKDFIEIDSTAHKAGAMKTQTPATATKDGVATISCVYCGKVLQTEVLPMLGDARNPVIPNTDAIA